MESSGYEGLSKSRLDAVKSEFRRYREDGGNRSFWWFCQNSASNYAYPELIRASSDWIEYSLNIPNHFDMMSWFMASEPSGPGGLIDGELIRKVHDRIQSNRQESLPIERFLLDDKSPTILQARDQWETYLEDHSGSGPSFQGYLDLSWETFKKSPEFRKAAPEARESSEDDSQPLGFLETNDFTPEDEESITSLMEGLDAYRKSGGKLPFADWLAGEQRATQVDEPTPPVDPRVTPPLTKDGRPIWGEPGYDYVSLKMPMLRGDRKSVV